MAQGSNHRAIHEVTGGAPARRGRILLIDEDPLVRDSMARALVGAGHEVLAELEWKTLLQRVAAEPFDLLLAELKGSRGRAGEIIAEARRLRPSLDVILLTEYATSRAAFELVRKGVYDLVHKPFDKDGLLLVVERALEQARLKLENRILREAAAIGSPAPVLVGQSRPTVELRDALARTAGRARPIVVRGEYGAGRTLIAHLLHLEREHGPLVTLSCGSLLPQRLNAWLGDAPDGGSSPLLDRLDDARATLLVEEIDLLPQELLAQLIRRLQARSATDALPAMHARVIATAGPTGSEAAQNLDRQWERAGAIVINVPPLRHRREDVAELARHFLHLRARRTGRPFRHLEPEAIRLLQKYRWPGNVRELRDLLDRADAAETEQGILRAATLAPWLSDAPVPAGIVNQAAVDPLDRLPLAEVEKRVILDTLAKFEGHRAKTATALGIGIRTLGIKLKKWREDGALAELPYL